MTDFTMPCPVQGTRVNSLGAEEDWECGGEIQVRITSYDRGRPATRLDPEEYPEVEWEIIEACSECGLNNDLTFDDSDPGMEKVIERITERAFEVLAEEEESLQDQAADRAYDEWRDRELEEREW